jgi:tetratricopeptide (TPR) repeat protein
MRSVNPPAVLLFILIFTAFFGGCSASRQPGLMQDSLTELPTSSPEGQEQDFDHALHGHLALPRKDQEARQAQAVAGLSYWRQFEKEAHQLRDSKLRQWYYMEYYLDAETWGVGLANSVRELKQAVDLDPSLAEAWGTLGKLCAAAGDLHKSREYLDKARQAALGRSQVGRPVEDADWKDILRNRAWTLRDMALWEEGLEAVNEGLRMFRGDRDLVLIKGLMLAGAGRYEQAMSLSVRMEPFDYPEFDLYHYGVRRQTSEYANRWIQSQALMAVGDYELARHVIGELNSYPYRRFLPHQQRFWNDVGLVAELAGDEDAGTYYAIGLISSHYGAFFPESGANLEPLVLNVPHAKIPFFTSFGGRFFVGGSPLSYAASQMNRMSLSTFEKQRSQAAWRALEALNIAERRNIRPDVVKAMRGRVYFSTDELALALADLSAAHESFSAKGVVDPGTSLLLGMLEMNKNRFAEAVPLLEESVAADTARAVAWRTLGVCQARLGQKDAAALAMDRALELDPYSVSGLYNRGLLHLQNQDFPAAVADLDRAIQLDPENREVQRLLQMAASGHRAAGGDPQELRLLTQPMDLEGSPIEPLTPEQIFASLEADIQSFFSVPDSVRQTMGPADQIVTSLQRQWNDSRDPSVRKILALAYLDRGLLKEAQTLLAPGWGEDLAPEEEVMLLYVDRLVGEETRARELSDMMLAGRYSGENPFLLALIPLEDRKHWSQTSLANNHYMEGYSAASGKENGDAKRYAANMKYGFSNIRMAVIQPGKETGMMAPVDPPDIRQMSGSYGGGTVSPTNGGSATGLAKKGNVRK